MELGRKWDPVAVVAGALAAMMALAYVGIMRSQGDQPLWWTLLILFGGSALAIHGARRSNPLRSVELLVAGAALTGLGLLALLSIGLPTLVAGGMCLIAGTADLKAESSR